MSKGVKLKANFSAKELAKKLDKLVADGLNVMGRNINLEIQNNIDKGVDVDGNKFEPLKQSTKDERARLGFSTNKPLERTGKMRGTKFTTAKAANPVFTIQMTGKSQRTGEHYGAFHNQGYTNSAKSMYPGAKVPQRKWFGIPENMQPGKPGYERAMKEVTKRIGEAFKTNFKVVGKYM